MQASTRRRAITKNGVVAGSIWDSRMRIDEVKGGVKVFNGEDNRGDDGSPQGYRRLRRNQSDNIATERKKKGNWGQPETAVKGSSDKKAIQLRKTRSESSNSPRISIENCQELRSLDITDGIGEKEVLVIGDGYEVGGEDKGDEEENETEVEVEKKKFDDKEVDLPLENQKNVEEEEKINQIHEITMSSNLDKKPPEVIDQPAIYPNLVKPAPKRFIPSVEVEEEKFDSISGNQQRMQNIVDLIMWRDISKSAFMFGSGSFFLISSSYAKEVNFSLISATSYLGLVYLAVIFLYKSILRRGGIEPNERSEIFMVGEEEAIWLLRLFLPYINELLCNLRALFSGDPATTMKLAVLLFVMARCGSSITIWTLAKLAFFGVFTIPKVYSSYSVQLSRYGKFWLERLRDGWESCTHKKAVAAGIFTLMWNLSSTTARVWAVFMLVVAVRFYKQYVVEEWGGEEGEQEEEVVVGRRRQEESKQGQGIVAGHHRQRCGPIQGERKNKKGG